MAHRFKRNQLTHSCRLCNSPDSVSWTLRRKKNCKTKALTVPISICCCLSPAHWFYRQSSPLHWALGPALGIDIFKSVSIDDSSKLVLSKGTGFTAGVTSQGAVSFNSGRLFAGVEGRYRSYGHKIEDVSRLTKQYFYFLVYAGWRFKAPGFAKKTLDWLNKVSPIDFD